MCAHLNMFFPYYWKRLMVITVNIFKSYLHPICVQPFFYTQANLKIHQVVGIIIANNKDHLYNQFHVRCLNVFRFINGHFFNQNKKNDSLKNHLANRIRRTREPLNYYNNIKLTLTSSSDISMRKNYQNFRNQMKLLLMLNFNNL